MTTENSKVTISGVELPITEFLNIKKAIDLKKACFMAPANTLKCKPKFNGTGRKGTGKVKVFSKSEVLNERIKRGEEVTFNVYVDNKLVLISNLPNGGFSLKVK